MRIYVNIFGSTNPIEPINNQNTQLIEFYILFAAKANGFLAITSDVPYQFGSHSKHNEPDMLVIQFGLLDPKLLTNVYSHKRPTFSALQIENLLYYISFPIIIFAEFLSFNFLETMNNVLILYTNISTILTKDVKQLVSIDTKLNDDNICICEFYILVYATNNKHILNQIVLNSMN